MNKLIFRSLLKGNYILSATTQASFMIGVGYVITGAILKLSK